MKTEIYDVAIIGSGLGGLLCGNILSKEGLRVCVIEKNDKTGGCLQIFARNKCIFNTGLNYTEGLEEGQILHTYFKFFGVLDRLKLKQLDKNGFEVITFQGKEYLFAQGEENFIRTLSLSFPEEEKNIRKYVEKIKSICHQFPLYNLDLEDEAKINYDELFSESAHEYLCSVTENEVLRNVLAGNNLLYAGISDKTPLYLHALTTYSFISSAWRLIDGSQQLATILAKNIHAGGGKILRNCEVTKLITESGRIKYAEIKDSSGIEAKQFISNIHPSNTLDLIDNDYPGKFHKKRIQSLENTMAMFTVYAVLNKNSFPYLNHNHYFFDNDTVWTASEYSKDSWPQSFFMYTPATSRSEEFADGFIVMTYMKWDELKQWENTGIENRGHEYLQFKNEKADKLLQLVEKKFPGIRKNITSFYTSTPLTWRDYTGTPQGSAYGILKDYNSPFKTLVMPKTKIPNLFFTGQNLNVHGILGVSIGAIMTCGEILGLKYLLEKIRNQR